MGILKYFMEILGFFRTISSIPEIAGISYYIGISHIFCSESNEKSIPHSCQKVDNDDLSFGTMTYSKHA
jgi:hypothetical protein